MAGSDRLTHPDRPMTDDKPQTPESTNPTQKVLRCFSGGFVAGTIASLFYALTRSVIAGFAARPLQYDNATTINIAVAVRTLVIGVFALGTFIFALSALGLIAYGIQLSIQHLLNRSPAP
jgi:Protein of unknown function (DUF3082)